MKALLSFLLYSVILPSFLFAQNSKTESQEVTVPTATKAAFVKAFPGSSNVKWEKEGKDYEVNFLQNANKMSAVYDKSGALKETELIIPNEQLPPAITAWVNEHYKGSKISEAAKITKANGTVNYEAEVNKKDLVFDASGKFIKEDKD